MIVIDEPYISDFLLKSIKANNFPVVSTEVAGRMIKDKSIHWLTEKEAIEKLQHDPEHKIYTNSENSIGWISKNAPYSKLVKQIQVFKNKLLFRELLADTFPDYFFKGVLYPDLHKMDLDQLIFPLILKPAVGFFSMAVHKIENRNEWTQVVENIEVQLNSTRDLYPIEVVDSSKFILEEWIEGEEYAIDCYYDRKGKPVVLNILHHQFSSAKDVSDRVYSTSTEIIEDNIDRFTDFLELLGRKMNLVNFPAHLEVRIDCKGRILPIEMNPLRFGGWCTTGDLSWYAYGFNSYEYFFKAKRPDWDKIFKTRKEKLYSLIVLDNNSGVKKEDIGSFDYVRLLQDFEKVLDLRKIDINKYPVFGFLFTETRIDQTNRKELENILNSDLTKYIKLKKDK